MRVVPTSANACKALNNNAMKRTEPNINMSDEMKDTSCECTRRSLRELEEKSANHNGYYHRRDPTRG